MLYYFLVLSDWSPERHSVGWTTIGSARRSGTVIVLIKRWFVSHTTGLFCYQCDGSLRNNAPVQAIIEHFIDGVTVINKK
jgi:hypothetical protein